MTNAIRSQPLRVSSLSRSLALTGIPIRAASRNLAARIIGAVQGDAQLRRERARALTAHDTRRTLGSLKGGALKAGQLLSTVESVFPQDPDGTWRQALTALQQDNPTLDFAVIEPVLVADLGSNWRSNFLAFSEDAVAAASIGQVYRAVWRDGRDVAVKVQIPGISQALLSDVRVLSRVLRVSALLAPGVAMPPLVRELQTRVAAELDYQQEATTQRRFANAYRGDPEVVIPAVVHVGDQILVTEWLPGHPLAAIATVGSAEQRDRAGLLYQRFFLQAPQRTGLLHTDPHPGNFRLTEDGRLGVLDFGSAMELPGGLPPTFGSLIAALQGDDPLLVRDRLADQGLLRRGSLSDVRKLMDYLAPFTEPARHEEFTFSREWLHELFARAHDPRNPDFIVAMKLSLPAEQLFTHRVWLGIVGVLSSLGARLPVASELRAYLPGFSGAQSARSS